MSLTDEDINYLIKRNDKLKEIRQMYEPLWEEIAAYILPGRVGVGYKPTPGAKQTKDIYDSSAIFSNDQLAAFMCGTMTPSSLIWAYLKLANEELNHVKEVMDWLEECSYRLHITRKRSNFYAEAPELYTDLGAFGEGCIFVEENPIKTIGFNGLYYKTLANSEYCTAEDKQGFVDTVFREFNLSARAAYQEWGENLPEAITKAKKDEPEKEFKFLHCAYPNDQKNGKPFISYYINLDEKKLISEKGYYELPFIVPRWRKTSGEVYGRGQGHIALPDTRTLNKAKELDLKAWAKDIDPATFERDGGIIGSLKLFAGGRNVAKDKEAIWTLDRHVRYDISQIKEQELVTAIRQMFYFDQLNLPEKSDMREMEVMIRYNLMQRLLGPAVGRIEVEFLKRLVEREFGMMYRARAFPPIPLIVKQRAREIDIEYEGPLARSQRLNDATAIQKLYAFAAPVANVYPAILDKIDHDKAMDVEAEALGVPSKVMRSQEEIAAIREQKAKQVAAEKQKQDMERLASGIGEITPLLKSWQEGQGGGTAATK
jgi:hypothetical protein